MDPEADLLKVLLAAGRSIPRAEELRAIEAAPEPLRDKMQPDLSGGQSPEMDPLVRRAVEPAPELHDFHAKSVSVDDPVEVVRELSRRPRRPRSPVL
jgi:hypothetical protein